MIEDHSNEQSPLLQILQGINKFLEAKTTSQVKSAELTVKNLCLDSKNINIITNIVLSDEGQYSIKLIVIKFFNLLVQQIIKKQKISELIVNTRKYNNQNQQIKKYIIVLKSQLDRLILSQSTPIQFKTDLISIQLKLLSRNREDWENSKTVHKMEYFFRKDDTALALAYFHQSIKVCYTIQGKIQLINKAISYLPNLAGFNFLKLTNVSVSQNNHQDKQPNVNFTSHKKLYNDFNDSFLTMLQLLNQTNSIADRNLVSSWCNNEIFFTLLKSVQQQVSISEGKGGQYLQLNEGMSKESKQWIVEWKQVLYKIIGKMTWIIGRKQMKNQCTIFIKYLQLLVTETKEYSYFPLKLSQFLRFKDELQYYLPIYINAIKYQLIRNDKIYPREVPKFQNGSIENQVININHKIVFLEYYVYRVYLITIARMENRDGYHENDNILQLLQEICSVEEIDYQAEDFLYEYIIYFITIIEKHQQLANFIKCLITTTFKIPNTNSYSFPNQLQVLNQELNRYHNNNEIKINNRNSIELCMILCITLYKYFSTDRYFVKNVIEEFVKKVVIQAQDKNVSIFNQNERIKTIFAMLVGNYLEDIQITVNTNHGPFFIYNKFIEQVAQEIGNNSRTSELLNHAYIWLIIKYVKLYKTLTEQFGHCLVSKEQPSIYSIISPYFHKISIELYPELYQNIVAFPIFHLANQSTEETIIRLRYTVNAIINYKPSQHVIMYKCEVFKLFNVLAQYEEYIPIFKDILDTIYIMCGNSYQQFMEFKDNVVDFCIELLKKGETMAMIDKITKDKLWMIICNIVSKYESSVRCLSQNQSSECQQNEQLQSLDLTNLNIFSQDFSTEQQSSKLKYLQLIYLTVSYQISQELLQQIFIQSKIILSKITSQITKYRFCVRFLIQPYQIQQISFLLILHKIIINHHEQIDENTVEKFMNIFWKNFSERVTDFSNSKSKEEDINYIDGKYNLIVVLLLRYKYRQINNVLRRQNQEIANRICQQIFSKQIIYRVDYDASLFSISTFEILSFLWSPLYQVQQLQYIIKNAHFALGACFLCLDRIYEYYRSSKQEYLRIPSFSNIQKTELVNSYEQMKQILSKLKQDEVEKYVDEFQLLRKFFNRLKENEKSLQWFYEAMGLYLFRRLYVEEYQNLLEVHKIRKSDGTIGYREVKSIKNSNRFK